MRDGAVYSGILHTVVIAVLAFGIPSFVAPPPSDAIIPVELVTLDAPEVEQPEPEPEPEPEPMAEEPAPTPEPPAQQARAEPEPPAPAPEPEPEPAPLAPEAKPDPPPEPPPPPQVKPAPKEPTRPPPTPRRRPEVKLARPKEPPKPPRRDQLTSILRNVEKLRESPRPQRRQVAKAETKGPPTRVVSPLEQNEMVRAIQQQLRRCWRLDPGALRAQDQVVEVLVALNPDGSVRRVDIVDVVRMVQDSYFRSAAENAKRAIHQCSPFRLPPRRYEVWRQLTLRFNPREMFGT